MSGLRSYEKIPVVFQNGGTDSQVIQLSNGCFGTILAPAGLNGKTFNVYATNVATGFGDVKLLAVDKTFATGANAFTSGEIAQIGAAQEVIIKLGSSVGALTTAYLLWKG